MGSKCSIGVLSVISCFDLNVCCLSIATISTSWWGWAAPKKQKKMFISLNYYLVKRLRHKHRFGYLNLIDGWMQYCLIIPTITKLHNSEANHLFFAVTKNRSNNNNNNNSLILRSSMFLMFFYLWFFFDESPHLSVCFVWLNLLSNFIVKGKKHILYPKILCLFRVE